MTPPWRSRPPRDPWPLVMVWVLLGAILGFGIAVLLAEYICRSATVGGL